jgi:hypothetical protein
MAELYYVEGHIINIDNITYTRQEGDLLRIHFIGTDNDIVIPGKTSQDKLMENLKGNCKVVIEQSAER